MKTLAVILLSCTLSFAQSGIMAEAKAKKEAEHHAAQVEQAKNLLVEKEELEAQIAVINQKLEKLDAGKDVKEDKSPVQFYTTYACCVGGSYVTITGNTNLK